MEKLKKKIRFDNKFVSYFRWPYIYLLLIAILVIAGFINDLRLGFFSTFIFLLGIGLTTFILLFTRKFLMREIINYSFYFGSVQNAVMEKFELPYIILDKNGLIIWNNEAFLNLVEEDNFINKSINGIVPYISRENLPQQGEKMEVVNELKGKKYRIVVEKLFIQENPDKTLHKNKLEEQELYTVYFFDITSSYELKVKYVEEKMVSALIYIDNFEEISNSIEDVRRPILVALIDRTINKFAKDHHAIYKKWEKDKYLLMFQRKHLEEMKDAKFDLLDTIREINIGNEMPVTLSMGIGVSDDTLAESYHYARMAIDLSLGRGGDQAVIKNNDKLSFYGGKSRSVEKNTRVKARIKSHAFRELLLESDKIIIMGHKVQDMDSLGAAIGLFACARHFEKEAHIILDNVTTSVKTLYDKIMDEPDTPEDIFINNLESVSYLSDESLLVVVDVNRPSYTEYPELLNYAKKIVVFDHHRTSAERIENTLISYVEPYASSTCEMVSEIIRYISDKVKLRPIEADALFAGISVDTKNFVDKAGVKTFEAAAFLKRNGADVVRVRKLFKNDMASYKAKATAVRDAEIYRENIAITVCPSNIVNPNLIGAQAADELLNISGIKASFVLTEVNGTIFISARSLDDVNVQIIMEKMGGGGHLSIAGTQLNEMTMEQAIEELKSKVNDYFEEGEDK